jgi:hypothetical protein
MQNPSGIIRLGAGGQTAAGSSTVQYMYGHSGVVLGFGGVWQLAVQSCLREIEEINA